ncbi:DNA polymerase zeta, partial [Teratosphaeriaceae sp. CCFEE 6253]
PNDPDTRLRLSQQSLQSHPKHLSFTSGTSATDSASPTKSTLTTLGKIRPPIDPRLATSYAQAFAASLDANAFIFGHAPPTSVEVEATVEPHVIYQDAYYSNERDVPERPREYAGQEFRLESTTLPYLPPFDKTGARL